MSWSMNPAAEEGGTSRPSVMAWMATGMPAAAMARAAATMCVDVAVHTAVRDDAHQVRRAARGLERGDEVQERGVAAEGAVLDGEVDRAEVHRDDAARADVGVPDLGIAHLAGRQAHVGAEGGEGGSADRSAQMRSKFGDRASAGAFASRCSRSPQPSRMQRTTGFGTVIAGPRVRAVMVLRGDGGRGNRGVWRVSVNPDGSNRLTPADGLLRPAPSGAGVACPAAFAVGRGSPRQPRPASLRPVHHFPFLTDLSRDKSVRACLPPAGAIPRPPRQARTDGQRHASGQPLASALARSGNRIAETLHRSVSGRSSGVSIATIAGDTARPTGSSRRGTAVRPASRGPACAARPCARSDSRRSARARKAGASPSAPPMTKAASPRPSSRQRARCCGKFGRGQHLAAFVKRHDEGALRDRAGQQLGLGRPFRRPCDPRPRARSAGRGRAGGRCG